LINGVVGYCQNQFVKATYQCSDDFSGVAQCGDHFYGDNYNDPVTNPPPAGTILGTKGLGPHNLVVGVVDQAGNVGTTVSVPYNVVSCPAP
jgi:hypothetical protein